MFTRRLNDLIMSQVAWQDSKGKGGANASASHLGSEKSWEVGFSTQDRSNPEEEGVSGTWKSPGYGVGQSW